MTLIIDGWRVLTHPAINEQILKLIEAILPRRNTGKANPAVMGTSTGSG